MQRLNLMRAVVAWLICLVAFPAQAQQTTAYDYDALGRLTTVLQTGGPASGSSVTYLYDPAGNRTSYVSTVTAAISISAASANEGSPLGFIVTRSGTTANAVTVNYATANGTAVSGTNYTALSGTLSFAVGVTTQTISVPTIDDNVYTSNLGMTVTLSGPSSGASLATASATGTIVNVDAQPTLSIAAASANEGSPLAFTVTRSGGTSGTATVNYATANGSAVAGTNYTATNGTLTFAAGVASQTVTVSTIDDQVYTSNLAMTVTLSSPSSGTGLGTASATGTVVNIDAQPTLSVAAASANEGSSLSFVVTRAGATGNVVAVSFNTSNGSAVAGTNYSSASGTVNFAAGVTSQVVTVATIDDHVTTGNLTMTATLSAPTGGAVLGTASATGTIVNTDTTWSSALTAGSRSPCPHGDCIYTNGYQSGSLGSMSVVNFGSYTITQLYSYQYGTTNTITLTETGTTFPPNSGWTSINIPGVGTIQRSAAQYSGSGTASTWTWSINAAIASGTVTIQ